MIGLSANAKTERVLIHAPFGRDGIMILNVLQRAGIEGRVCKDLDGFFQDLADGVGTIVIGDEVLERNSVERLSTILRAQPHWSDLPMLIMTSGGDATA